MPRDVWTLKQLRKLNEMSHPVSQTNGGLPIVCEADEWMSSSSVMRRRFVCKRRGFTLPPTLVARCALAFGFVHLYCCFTV
ncbi:hypothetical protein CEXT_54821 [Caerostris extrusa]|uniref:DUF5641 domain-containing protein n=1 Tax=Caerostris extrusa TaxID=172846 RepID=A0AAV4X8G8_CAEEX|nr:hypothetical protein CEXT_54821 [Caerostris extrusa]